MVDNSKFVTGSTLNTMIDSSMQQPQETPQARLKREAEERKKKQAELKANQEKRNENPPIVVPNNTTPTNNNFKESTSNENSQKNVSSSEDENKEEKRFEYLRQTRKKVKLTDTHVSKTLHIRKEVALAMELVSDWGEKYRIADMGIMIVLLTDSRYSKKLQNSDPDLYLRLQEIWESEHQ